MGGTSAAANGMAHALLWTAKGGMVDLNTRVPTETDRVLQSVVALADGGSLLVSATEGLLLRPGRRDGGGPALTAPSRSPPS